MQNAKFQREIIESILKERNNQNSINGGEDFFDNHSMHDWIAIITKHLGLCAVTTSYQFKVQMGRVAALAIAAIESAERHKDDDEGWRKK